MLEACERVMRGLCAEMGAELHEFHGDTGHVHLLIRYPPKLSVSTLVNRLKGVSAHYLRKEFTGCGTDSRPGWTKTR
jgi:putative transposase